MESLLHSVQDLKVNKSIRGFPLDTSASTIPGDMSPVLSVAYGIVGPAIIACGLLGNVLILIVIGKSSIKGKNLEIGSEIKNTNCQCLLTLKSHRGHSCLPISAGHLRHGRPIFSNPVLDASIARLLVQLLQRHLLRPPGIVYAEHFYGSQHIHGGDYDNRKVFHDLINRISLVPLNWLIFLFISKGTYRSVGPVDSNRCTSLCEPEYIPPLLLYWLF